MALVQPPVLLLGQPQPAHRLERDVQRPDRAGLDAGEAKVEVHAPGGEQFSRRLRFRLALRRQIDVPPAGESIFEIPGRLAVADQDELGQGASPRSVA